MDRAKCHVDRAYHVLLCSVYVSRQKLLGALRVGRASTHITVELQVV